MTGADLSLDDVVRAAHALTGADDPTPDHFLDNLAAVVDATNREAALTDTRGLLAQLSLALRNRIEVDAYLVEHPEVETGTVGAPIVLTGLPRSGTTYFQYLFDQDPRLRMVRTWEGERPVPPPAVDRVSARSRRDASIEHARRVRGRTGGQIDAFHLTDVDGPQECLAILDQTFLNPGLLWMMAVPSYLEFLLHDADMDAAYRHHARVLQLLQWGAPPQRWSLKWPCHLLALDAMAAVFPGAAFVVTHRDPVQALASNCSLAKMLRAGTSPNADPHQIGRDMLELVRQHVDRLVAFDRSPEPLSPVVHVDYYELVDAPDRVMPRVFEAVGLDWTPDVDERVRRWREENPKGKRGSHSYALEEYGLERGEVADTFAEYVDRFAIPSEAAGDPVG